MPKYRKASNPKLIFFMPLDSSRAVLPGINRGRMVLIDDLGVIGRWVFTSSYDGKQASGDWNKTGGVAPPSWAMPGGKFWEFHTKRLFQPGQPVDDGFLITFNSSTSYKTVDNATRSELMVHDDKNRKTNLGSYGCPVALTTEEYLDFCLGIKESVDEEIIPLVVLYSF